ncbi:MAG: helix-turn-helix domain-containing protein [Rubritalea sp.]
MKKLIKTKTDYELALERLEELMLANPDEGTADADELELLAHLIEIYESKTVDIPPPSPIEAIKFRMEQQGLKQKDLVDLIGNKARVSEILSGKRKLTIDMVKTLSKELDISTNTLLGLDQTTEDIDPSQFPIAEMRKKDWFGDITLPKLKASIDQHLKHFFRSYNPQAIEGFNRTGFKVDANLDEYALQAWRCQVLNKSDELEIPIYRKKDLSPEFIKSLAILTQFDSGIDLVIKALRDKGVAVITEVEHLSKTYLDGAAMMNKRGNPVIGLTCRHNRLDNFWHTLFHELAHVVNDLKSPNDVFFDDSEAKDLSKIEKQADDFALNTLIPPQTWKNEIRHLEKAGEIRDAAKRLSIHPSIIAGRLRREHGNYRLHRTLLGSGEVR